MVVRTRSALKMKRGLMVTSSTTSCPSSTPTPEPPKSKRSKKATSSSSSSSNEKSRKETTITSTSKTAERDTKTNEVFHDDHGDGKGEAAMKMEKNKRVSKITKKTLSTNADSSSSTNDNDEMKRETSFEKKSGATFPQVATTTNGATTTSLLFSLPSDCVEAALVCRPSKRNRSPYVADIFVPSLNRQAICHVPNLGMGGKCVPGVTLLVKPQRDKRGNLLGPDAVNPKHNTPKCEFVAQLLRVDESQLHPNYTPAWVGAHPRLGEVLVEELIQQHMKDSHVDPDIDSPEPNALKDVGRLTSMKKQVNIKDGTRADFVVQQASGKPRIIEVKTVIDTDYCAAWKLPDRSECVFLSKSSPSDAYVRTAVFPWGSKSNRQQGPDGEPVVSARAIKHVCELTELVASGSYDATIVFLVIRGDAQRFRPNHDACPSFTKYLKVAQQKGVQLLAKRVRWGEGKQDGSEGSEQVGQCFDDGWLDIEWP